MSSPHRLLVKVSHASGLGADVDAHPAMKTGDATVVAALGHQAKVIAKVKVLKDGVDASAVPKPNAVFFDKVTTEEQLSLTAGTLGAVSVPIADLKHDEPRDVAAALVSQAASSSAKFSLHLTLTRTAMPAAAAPGLAAAGLAGMLGGAGSGGSAGASGTSTPGMRPIRSAANILAARAAAGAGTAAAAPHGSSAAGSINASASSSPSASGGLPAVSSLTARSAPAAVGDTSSSGAGGGSITASPMIASVRAPPPAPPPAALSLPPAHAAAAAAAAAVPSARHAPPPPPAAAAPATAPAASIAAPPSASASPSKAAADEAVAAAASVPAAVSASSSPAAVLAPPTPAATAAVALPATTAAIASEIKPVAPARHDDDAAAVAPKADALKVPASSAPALAAASVQREPAHAAVAPAVADSAGPEPSAPTSASMSSAAADPVPFGAAASGGDSSEQQEPERGRSERSLSLASEIVSIARGDAIAAAAPPAAAARDRSAVEPASAAAPASASAAAPVAAPAPAPVAAALAPASVAVGGGDTPLPCRLIDYFGVMVSAAVTLSPEEAEAMHAAAAGGHGGGALPGGEPHPEDSDEEGAGGSGAGDAQGGRHAALFDPDTGVFRRRVGKLQYRFPKHDHADVPLPEGADWFIFPNGIGPITQPANAQFRPPTRRSVFVLSNVGGEGQGQTMYGCCLTAYNKEVDEGTAGGGGGGGSGGDGDGSGDGDGATATWWPVVLFMLSRYPVVPTLQGILESVYNVYDAGSSTGLVSEAELPRPYCALSEYLRYLVYEVPLPIRRLNMATELFLPGPTPRAGRDGTHRLFLPAPDVLPHLQFSAGRLLRAFDAASILALVSALALERRVVIVARAVQHLVEIAETAMALLYPLKWELPFIPVLPAHLAPDCLASPIPFLYGVLTSYAASALTALDPLEAANLVVVDVTAGRVDVGIAAYLRRRRRVRFAALQGVPLHPADADLPDALALDEKIRETLLVAAEAAFAEENGIDYPAEDAAAGMLAPGFAFTPEESAEAEEIQAEEDERLGYGAEPNGHAAAAAPPLQPLLRMPEPLFSDALAELQPLTEAAFGLLSAEELEEEEAALGGGTGAGPLLLRPAAPLTAAEEALNGKLQGLMARIMAVLLHGYRGAAFFPGLPPQHGATLSAEAFVDTKVKSLAAAAALRRAKSLTNAAAAGGAMPAARDAAGVGAAANEAARAFYSALCETQCLSVLLGRHTSLNLRPFHALTALLSPTAPALADTAKWKPPSSKAEITLVVPPPGYTALRPWQITDAATGARALPPPPGHEGDLPPPQKVKKAKRDKASGGRQDEKDVARRWTSAEVAAALLMDAWTAQELELLASASARGNNGLRGDDVGGIHEATAQQQALSETAALLAAAAEAAGESSNPVRGRVGQKGSSGSGNGRRRVEAAVSQRRGRGAAGSSSSSGGGRGRWISWRRATAVTLEELSADDGGDDGDDSSGSGAGAGGASGGGPQLSKEAEEELLYGWAQACLTRGIGVASASLTAAGGNAGVGTVLGVPWTPRDDELVKILAAPGGARARASLVFVLQTQLLLSAGLSAPLCGANPKLPLQLQPLLGLGVSAHVLASARPLGGSSIGGTSLASAVGGSTGAGSGSGGSGTPLPASASSTAATPAAAAAAAAASSTTARTLLTSFLSPARFQRLAAICCALLAASVEARDYTAAAPLLQLSFFLYTEPTTHPKDASSVQAALAAAAASPAVARKPPASAGGAWKQSRQYLSQELSGEGMWRQLPFWEAYVLQALAVEEQQMRLLHLQALRHAPAGAAATTAVAAPTGGAGGAAAGSVGAGSAATASSSSGSSSDSSIAAVALSKTPAGASYIYSLVSALIPAMLQLGMPVAEARAFVSRMCVRFRMPLGEERTVLSLVDSLGASEGAAGGAAAAHRRQLNYYGPFLTGSAAAAGSPLYVPPQAAPPASTGSGTAGSASGSGSGGSAGAGAGAAPAAAAAAVAGAVAGAAAAAGGAAVEIVRSVSSGAASAVNAATGAATNLVNTAASAVAATAGSVASTAASVGTSIGAAVGVSPTSGAASASGTGAAGAAGASGSGSGTAASSAESTAAAFTGSASAGAKPAASTSGSAAAGTTSAASAGSGADAAAAGAAGAASVPQHPWVALPQKDAEAAARNLVALRRLPPPPPPAVLALVSSAAKGAMFLRRKLGVSPSNAASGSGAAAGGAGADGSSDAVTQSSVSAPALVQEGGVGAGGEAAAPDLPATAAGAGVSASASLSVSAGTPSGSSHVSSASTGSASGKMQVTKAFGKGVGLSVLASTFDAAAGADDAASAAVATAPAYIKSGKQHGALDAALEGVSRTVRHRLGAGTVATGAGGGAGSGSVAGTGVAMSCLAFRGHAPGASITTMSHDAGDHRVVTGGNDGRVTLWDMHTRTHVHTYEQHSAAVTAVRVVGDVVVSASQDGSVRVAAFTRSVYGATAARASFAPKPSPADKAKAKADKAKSKSAASAAVPASMPAGMPEPPAPPAPKTSFFSFGRKKAGTTAAAAAAAAAAAEAEKDKEKDKEKEKFDDEEPDTDDDDSDGEGEVAGAAAPHGGDSDATSGADAGSAAAAAAAAAAYGDSASTPSAGSAGGLSAVLPFPIPSLLRQSSGSGSKFTSALRLTGHSGPVTAIDVWEKPADPKSAGWFRRVTPGSIEGVPAPAPMLLPARNDYLIATGGSDGAVRLWSAEWHVSKGGRARGAALNFTTKSNLHGSGSIIESVKLSSDGRLCATAGRDGRIGVVDVGSGNVWIMTKPKPASKGFFGWGAREAAPIDPIAAPSGLPIVSIAIDVAHRPVTVTSAGADGTVRVWDILRSGGVASAFPSGSPVWAFTTVPAHGGGAPRYNADGSLLAPASVLGDAYLVSGHEDGCVRKWDARKATVPLACYRGHAGAVTSITSLGDKLVSGGTDGTVRLWDAQTGLSLRCDGHGSQVCGASAHEDYFVTASWDGTLRCWFPAV